MAVTRKSLPRNPGPSWGFAFLRIADRLLPWLLFRPALAVGTAIAFAFMPQQRKNAADYLRAVTKEEPGVVPLWRQFFAFTESFMELLRLGRGGTHVFHVASGPQGEAFKDLAQGKRPALFGTFHVGNSDLLGYALSNFDRQIHMIRIQVENSSDIRWMEERFSDTVSFIWVDHPEAMLFALKEAIEAGDSIAMKCDRLEQSGRREAFDFFGKQRLFPFTIYHFSLLFNMPVAFAVGWPAGRGRTLVDASAIFEPDPAASRASNIERAREHFQNVLHGLEAKLSTSPELWFNFGPLNPESRDPVEKTWGQISQ